MSRLTAVQAKKAKDVESFANLVLKALRTFRNASVLLAPKRILDRPTVSDIQNGTERKRERGDHVLVDRTIEPLIFLFTFFFFLGRSHIKFDHVLEFVDTERQCSKRQQPALHAIHLILPTPFTSCRRTTHNIQTWERGLECSCFKVDLS